MFAAAARALGASRELAARGAGAVALPRHALNSERAPCDDLYHSFRLD